MSTFSRLTFGSSAYDKFRPKYSSKFYLLLKNYIANTGQSLPVNETIDLGCGTGVASYPLLQLSQHVTGLDASKAMIDFANSVKHDRCQENEFDESQIDFKVGSIESYLGESQNRSGSFDLITAAQCLHWVENYSDFFKNIATLLKPNGVLAYWFYVDPVFVDIKGDIKVSKSDALSFLNSSYLKYSYDDPRYLGKYWEQPGRNILRDLYKDINKFIPSELYSNVIINTHQFSKSGDVNNNFIVEPMTINLVQFAEYFTTFSAMHAFKEANGDSVDVPNLFLKDAEENLGCDMSQIKVTTSFNTGYVFMTKK